jgi:hypothetical protein
MKYLVMLACLFGLWISAKSQNVVTGTVLDSLTREPVPFANVYFANTSLGTYSSEDGKFTLKNFPDGKYDLTVSFVGYQTAQIALEFTGTSRNITFLLSQKITQLAEVVISPDTSDRPYNMRRFIRGFIGETENAGSCKIRNPKDLYLDYDKASRILTGFSRKPLVIENTALGYKIFYDLQLFELDLNSSQQLFLGIPRFEELQPKNNAQLKKWEKERVRAYKGSFCQFIHLLKNGTMQDEFVVTELFKVRDRTRPPSKYLDKQIAYWTEQLMKGKRSGGKQDSLAYYVELRKKPELKDSLGRVITDVSVLLDPSRNVVLYTGYLYIVYKKEREEFTYALNNHRDAVSEQHSTVEISYPGIAIYENGYYEDVRNVFFDGYMGWAEKISDLLPLEYRPPVEKE